MNRSSYVYCPVYVTINGWASIGHLTVGADGVRPQVSRPRPVRNLVGASLAALHGVAPPRRVPWHPLRLRRLLVGLLMLRPVALEALLWSERTGAN
eukprot:1176114-Prorocentrum_minimum.AAC.5